MGNKISMCGEKCTSDQSISKYPFKVDDTPMVVHPENIDFCRFV